MRRRLVRRIKEFRRFAHEIGLVEASRLSLLRRMGSTDLRRMHLDGVEVLVRPASPDIRVARKSLGGEFDCLRHAWPADAEGLIVDAGGYIGTAAIALARMYPRARIVTIEPSTENFAILKRNTAAYPTITAINAAVVAVDRGPIELMDRGTGAWGFTIVDEKERKPHPDGTRLPIRESVETVSMDSVLDTYGAGRALIAKIDIEGAEMALFRHPGWLDRVRVVMIELHEKIVPGCDALFWQTNAGRFVFRPGPEKYVSVGPLQT